MNQSNSKLRSEQEQDKNRKRIVWKLIENRTKTGLKQNECGMRLEHKIDEEWKPNRTRTDQGTELERTVNRSEIEEWQKRMQKLEWRKNENRMRPE